MSDMLSDNDNARHIIAPMAQTKAKRDEFLVEIRKKKNQSLVQQIRKKYYRTEIDEIIPQLQEESNANIKTSFMLQSEGDDEDTIRQFQVTANQYCTEFFNILRNQFWDDLLPVVKALRELIGSKAIVDSGRVIISTGIVPHLISLLDDQFYKLRELQTEIAWLLANISAGNSQDTSFLVEQNVIATLTVCLKSGDNEDLQENAMWTLANICGEPDLAYRDAVMDQDVLNLVVRKLCTTPKKVSYYRTAAWLMSNLVRGVPYPAHDKINKCFGALTHLFEYKDPLILQHSLLSLANLSEEGKEINLKSIAENNLVQKTITYINNENETISLYALKTAGNIAKGNRRYASSLFDPEIFKSMPQVLSHNNREIRKEACMTLTNILTNEFDDHDYVVEHGLIPVLIELAGKDDDDEMKALATNCLYNFIYDCKFEEAKVCLENGFVEVLLQNLGSQYVRLVENSLIALYKVFEHGEGMKKDFNGYNPLTYTIAEKNLVPIIENLTNHPDNNICSKVSVLLDKFFGMNYNNQF